MRPTAPVKEKVGGLSSFGLHVLAMVFMLCDHSWATLFPQWEWLTCIGRLAFPIFAFMIAEGFYYTRNRWKYLLRLVTCAIISEIPFNLMMGGTVFYPMDQNVLWTFVLALLLMMGIEKARSLNRIWLTALVSLLAIELGWIVGMVTMVDYYGFGVLMVFVFYFLRRDPEGGTKNIFVFLGQLVLLYLICEEGISGYTYQVTVFGLDIYFARQTLAVFALIPIWLYKGRKGYDAPWFRRFCYGFYPAHILVLYGILQLYWALQ